MKLESFDVPRAEMTASGVWRLGDVLHELLDRYGLTEASSATVGTPAVCSDAGLFSVADLPATAGATY